MFLNPEAMHDGYIPNPLRGDAQNRAVLVPTHCAARVARSGPESVAGGGGYGCARRLGFSVHLPISPLSGFLGRHGRITPDALGDGHHGVTGNYGTYCSGGEAVQV